MQVDHGQYVQDMGLDQLAEGDDHRQIGPETEYIIDDIGHLEAQIQGGGLDR